MKIPSNLIKTKYTIGNEFVKPDTNESYQGYYYELNGSYFEGDKFNSNAPKIIKKENQNLLLNNPKTATYAKLTGYTSQIQQQSKVTALPQISSDYMISDYSGPRFFAQKVNSNPIIIKEIDEKTYNSLKTSPLYITTYISNTQPAAQAYSPMTSLKTFLKG